MKRLWNFFRSTKTDRSMFDEIGLSDLHKYFSAKFCDSEYTNDVILEAERCVQEKYNDILNGELNSKVMSDAKVNRYIKKLNLGSSPGIDGIISEHTLLLLTDNAGGKKLRRNAIMYTLTEFNRVFRDYVSLCDPAGSDVPRIVFENDVPINAESRQHLRLTNTCHV